MYLEDFVEIIGGKLCNAPTMSLLNKPTAKLSALTRSDAFILRDKSQLKEAINRGAYAIVSKEFIEIEDKEVSLILVQSLHTAINKFVKYIKLTHNIEIFYFNQADFNLAKSMSRGKNIAFVSNIFDLLEVLDYKIIVIDFELLFFELESLENTRNFLFKILRQTLFELQIEYENNIFELILPKIFTPNLNDILHFFRKKHIDFKMNFDENLLLPTFINTSAKPLQYGQSTRFIYATKDRILLEKYIDFTLSASWGRTLLLSNVELNLTRIQARIYKNNKDLLEAFLCEKYHFFVVFGIEQNEIALNAESSEPNLF